MPDITMCGSVSCHFRTTCYRNEASGTKPCGYSQSYFIYPPNREDECDYYWNRNYPEEDNNG